MFFYEIDEWKNLKKFFLLKKNFIFEIRIIFIGKHSYSILKKTKILWKISDPKKFKNQGIIRIDEFEMKKIVSKNLNFKIKKNSFHFSVGIEFGNWMLILKIFVFQKVNNLKIYEFIWKTHLKKKIFSKFKFLFCFYVMLLFRWVDFSIIFLQKKN